VVVGVGGGLKKEKALSRFLINIRGVPINKLFNSHAELFAVSVNFVIISFAFRAVRTNIVANDFASVHNIININNRINIVSVFDFLFSSLSREIKHFLYLSLFLFLFCTSQVHPYYKRFYRKSQAFF
jgi:hypothetical protein